MSQIFFSYLSIAALVSTLFSKPLFALTLIPSQTLSDNNWIKLQYSKIPSTEYKITNNQIRVSVRSSASPLIYKFETLKRLKRLSLKATLDSMPKLPPNSDDFILRIGPAISGTQKLSVLERLVAPEWIMTLSKIASQHSVGLKNIELSLVSLEPAPIWKTRSHPQSKLIQETIALVVKNPGTFNLDIDYPQDLQPCLGLWIGSDGDESKSNFDMSIDELSVEFYEEIK